MSIEEVFGIDGRGKLVPSDAIIEDWLPAHPVTAAHVVIGSLSNELAMMKDRAEGEPSGSGLDTDDLMQLPQVPRT